MADNPDINVSGDEETEPFEKKSKGTRRGRQGRNTQRKVSQTVSDTNTNTSTNTGNTVKPDEVRQNGPQNTGYRGNAQAPREVIHVGGDTPKSTDDVIRDEDDDSSGGPDVLDTDPNKGGNTGFDVGMNTDPNKGRTGPEVKPEEEKPEVTEEEKPVVTEEQNTDSTQTADDIEEELEEGDVVKPDEVSQEAQQATTGQATPVSNLDFDLIDTIFERGHDQVRVRKDIDDVLEKLVKEGKVDSMKTGVYLDNVLRHIKEKGTEDEFKAYQKVLGNFYIDQFKESLALDDLDDGDIDYEDLDEFLDDITSDDDEKKDIVFHDEEGHSIISEDVTDELRDLVKQRRELDGASASAEEKIDELLERYDIDKKAYKRLKKALKHKKGEPNYKDLVTTKALDGWGRTLMGYANYGLGTVANVLDVGTKMLGAFRQLTGAFLSTDPMSVPSRLLSASMVGLNAMRDGMDKQGLLLGIREDADKGIVRETRRGAKYYKDRDKAEKAAQYLMQRYNDAIQEAAGPDGDVTQLSFYQMKAIVKAMEKEISPEIKRIVENYHNGLAPTMEDRAIMDAYATILRDFNSPIKEEMMRVRMDKRTLASLGRDINAKDSFISRMQERNRRRRINADMRWDSKEEKARQKALRLAEKENERQRKRDEAISRGLAAYNEASKNNDKTTMYVLEALGMDWYDKFKAGKPTRPMIKEAMAYYDKLYRSFNGRDDLTDEEKNTQRQAYFAKIDLEEALKSQSQIDKENEAARYAGAYYSDKQNGRELNVIIKDALGYDTEDHFHEHIPDETITRRAIKELTAAGLSMAEGSDDKKANDEKIAKLNEHLKKLKAEKEREKNERYEMAYYRDIAEMNRDLLTLKDILGKDIEDELVEGVPKPSLIDRAIDVCDSILASSNTDDDTKKKYTERKEILINYRKRIQDEKKAQDQARFQTSYDSDVAAGRLDKQYIKDILGMNAEDRMKKGEPTPYLLNDAIKQYAIALEKYNGRDDLTDEEKAQQEEYQKKMEYLQDYREHVKDVARGYFGYEPRPKRRTSDVVTEDPDKDSDDNNNNDEQPADSDNGQPVNDSEGFNEGMFFSTDAKGNLVVDSNNVSHNTDDLIKLMKHLKDTKGKKEYKKYQKALIQDIVNFAENAASMKKEDGTYLYSEDDVKVIIDRLSNYINEDDLKKLLDKEAKNPPDPNDKDKIAPHKAYDFLLFDDNGKRLVTKKQLETITKVLNERPDMTPKDPTEGYFTTDKDGIHIDLDDFIKDPDRYTDVMDVIRDTDPKHYRDYQMALLEAAKARIADAAELKDENGDFVFVDDYIDMLIDRLNGNIDPEVSEFETYLYDDDGRPLLDVSNEDYLRKIVADIRKPEEETPTETAEEEPIIVTETPTEPTNTVDPNNVSDDTGKPTETAGGHIATPEEIKAAEEAQKKAEQERLAREKAEREAAAKEAAHNVTAEKERQAAEDEAKKKEAERKAHGDVMLEDKKFNDVLDVLVTMSDVDEAKIENVRNVSEYLKEKKDKFIAKNGKTINFEDMSDECLKTLKFLDKDGALPYKFFSTKDRNAFNKELNRRNISESDAELYILKKYFNEEELKKYGYIIEYSDNTNNDDNNDANNNTGENGDDNAESGINDEVTDDNIGKEFTAPTSEKEFYDKAGYTPTNDDGVTLMSKLKGFDKATNKKNWEKTIFNSMAEISKTDPDIYNKVYGMVVNNGSGLFGSGSGITGRGAWTGICTRLYLECYERQHGLTGDNKITPMMDYAMYGIEMDQFDEGETKTEEFRKDSFEKVTKLCNSVWGHETTDAGKIGMNEELVKKLSEMTEEERKVHGHNTRYMADLVFLMADKMMGDLKEADIDNYKKMMGEYDAADHKEKTAYYKCRQHFIDAICSAYFGNNVDYQMTYEKLQTYQKVADEMKNGIIKVDNIGRITYNPNHSFHDVMHELRSIGALDNVTQSDITKKYKMAFDNYILPYKEIEGNFDKYIEEHFNTDYDGFIKNYVTGRSDIPDKEAWLRPYVQNMKSMIRKAKAVKENTQVTEINDDVADRVNHRHVASKETEALFNGLVSQPITHLELTDDEVHIIANRMASYLIRLCGNNNDGSDAYKRFREPILKDLFGKGTFGPESFLNSLETAINDDTSALWVNGQLDETNPAVKIYKELFRKGIAYGTINPKDIENGTVSLSKLRDALKSTIKVNFGDLEGWMTQSKITPEVYRTFADEYINNEFYKEFMKKRRDNGEMFEFYKQSLKRTKPGSFEESMRYIIGRVVSEMDHIMDDYNTAVKDLDKRINSLAKYKIKQSVSKELRADALKNIKARIMFKYFGSYEYADTFDDLGLFDMSDMWHYTENKWSLTDKQKGEYDRIGKKLFPAIIDSGLVVYNEHHTYDVDKNNNRIAVHTTRGNYAMANGDEFRPADANKASTLYSENKTDKKGRTGIEIMADDFEDLLKKYYKTEGTKAQGKIRDQVNELYYKLLNYRGVLAQVPKFQDVDKDEFSQVINENLAVLKDLSYNYEESKKVLRGSFTSEADRKMALAAKDDAEQKFLDKLNPIKDAMVRMSGGNASPTDAEVIAFLEALSRIGDRWSDIRSLL